MQVRVYCVVVDDLDFHLQPLATACIARFDMQVSCQWMVYWLSDVLLAGKRK